MKKSVTGAFFVLASIAVAQPASSGGPLGVGAGVGVGAGAGVGVAGGGGAGVQTIPATGTGTAAEASTTLSCSTRIVAGWNRRSAPAISVPPDFPSRRCKPAAALNRTRRPLPTFSNPSARGLSQAIFSP